MIDYIITNTILLYLLTFLVSPNFFTFTLKLTKILEWSLPMKQFFLSSALK